MLAPCSSYPQMELHAALLQYEELETIRELVALDYDVIQTDLAAAVKLMAKNLATNPKSTRDPVSAGEFEAAKGTRRIHLAVTEFIRISAQVSAACLLPATTLLCYPSAVCRCRLSECTAFGASGRSCIVGSSCPTASYPPRFCALLLLDTPLPVVNADRF